MGGRYQGSLEKLGEQKGVVGSTREALGWTLNPEA